MKRKFTFFKVLFLFLTMALSIQAIAQETMITGSVTDATDGSTLPGVSILVKGTSTGTVTDLDGQFKLNTKIGATLVFSYVGYNTVELAATGNMKVALKIKQELMQEVLVIGYGTQKKSDRTGSVYSVKAEDMNKGVLTDPVQGIQGKVAGVTITKKGGDPNAGFDIKIRGGSGGLETRNSPLYVIDGVPGVDPTTVASEDIESFNVLKDASAAAIYGSRGANGVIIITTKRGSEKKESLVEFSSYISSEKVANRLDLLSAGDIRKYVADNNLNFVDGGGDVDWQDEIYRRGVSQNYSLAVSGGGEKSVYRTSITHSMYDGVIKGSSKKRTTARINLDQKALNNRLLFQTGIAGTFEKNTYVNYGGNGQTDILYQAFQHNPTDPVYDSAGNFYNTQRTFNYWNPSALIDQIQNERSAKRFFGFAKASLEIIKGLTLNENVCYTRDDQESFYFEPSTMNLGTTEGFGRRSYGNFESKIMETTINFKKTFEKHNLEVVGGHSWQHDQNTGFAAQGNQPFIDYLESNDLSNLLSLKPGSITSYNNGNTLISFFGRAIYNFNSKYFLTGTVRRDGSSRFGDNNKWGWFPSASAMWNITGEPFMQNVSVVNNLRLRAGFGITGNQEIGNHNAELYYNAAGSSINFETGDDVIKYEFAANANPDLRWESNREINIGIDYGLFNDRISGSFEVYKKNTFDLLGVYSIPKPPNESDRIYANGGKIDVQGFEFNIQAFPVNTKNLEWKTGIVFTTYKQEVISLSSDKFPMGNQDRGWVSVRGGVGTRTQVIMPGYGFGTWYMPEFAGLSSDGKFLYYTKNGGVTREITMAEPRVVGKAQPDFEIGWSNYFTFYKNFDASFTIRGIYGTKIFNTTRLMFGNAVWLPDMNVLQSALDEKAGGLTDNPQVSSYYLEDGSFIRLDNLSIGYNFKNVPGFKSVRAYFASNNLLTLTKYSGIDPETGYNGTEFGLDQFNVYPKTRTFTFGINVTL
jgi:TonB-linked SusC/RagA family outer membrane protein